jgi:hypothetical protein
MRLLLLQSAMLLLASCAPRQATELPPELESPPEPLPVVVIPNHINLARGSAISASSTSSKWEGEGPASTVADGDPSTRWASELSDPQALTFDLGKRCEVRSLRLLWETAAAAEFAIQISADGEAWQTVAERKGGTEGPRIDEINFNPVSGQWLRLYLRKRATQYGYSLYEVEIY